MSNLYQCLSHSKWNYKYYVIFIPNNRKGIIYNKVRTELEKIVKL